MTNVGVGIIWQLTLPVLTIYFVIREYKAMFITIGITIVTSIFLHYNWFKNLEKNDNLEGSEWAAQKTQSAMQGQPILK
ncbi:MAG: hypothetical protein BWY69_00534 [Planctomycetes bacterium ADurb.Bin401]|nr:MAG: hypothetical protein BWY69_00534 [Planctomycetes bacterium ADurb.Bin401]